jgi:hypothetical protein
LAPTANSAALERTLRRPAIPAIVRFTVPSLAAMISVATLLYCLFLHGSLFRDSDTGWHIRNGEAILAQRALPVSDPYSFSKPNQPWFAWEWGADALMGAANRLGGLTAVSAMFAFAIACASWLWVRLSFAMDGDFLLAGLFAPLMVTTASPHWLARPHVFGWVLLLMWAIYLERVGRASSPGEAGAFGVWRDAYPVLFAALWANVHGSFFLAPLLAAIYAVSYLIRPLLWPLDRLAEHAQARRFLRIALAAAAGTLINPYGWRLHAHVFSYLSDGRLTSQIAEFQSFNFHDKDATQMAIVMGLAALGGVLALTQRNIAHFLLAALFFWGGLRSARMLPLVALVILPGANSAIATGLRRMRGLRQPLLDRLDGALAYSARLRRIDLRLHGAGFVAVAATLSLFLLHMPGFSADAFPVAAAQTVEKLPADARILTSDSYGGYLIYRFNGSRKVFFDGRSDFYGADFLDQYSTLAAARPGWRDIVRKYRFTHALLPASSTLAGALTQSGWTTIYQDRVATLLESR